MDLYEYEGKAHRILKQNNINAHTKIEDAIKEIKGIATKGIK